MAIDRNSDSSLYAVYSSMVAGAFPVAQGMDVERALNFLTHDILDTTLVHYLVREHEGQVYYMAIPSKVLASSGEFATPLAAAFPDSPEHKGDACYVHVFGEYAAGLIKRENSLRLLVSFTNEVLDALAVEQLKLVHVSDGHTPVRMSSTSWLYRHLSTRVANVVAAVCLGCVVLSTLTLFGSKAVQGYASGNVTHNSFAAAQKANDVIQSTQMVSPLVQQVERINALATVVVKTGGWIEGYEYDQSGGERFVVSLPSWVSSDVVRDLGIGVRTELQPAQNLIWATRYNRKGEGIKGKGPTGLLAPTAEAVRDSEARAATGPADGTAAGGGGSALKNVLEVARDAGQASAALREMKGTK